MADTTVKALIVDDEDALRGILKLSLSYFGIKVVGEARNGKEALEVYRSCGANVILMDVNMPVMDGLTALGEIRKIDPDAVVILITASDEEDVMDEGRRLGAKGFLRKPLVMEELHRDITSHLRLFFAKQKGEALTDDYIKYVVRPGFRPEDEGKHFESPPMSGATKNIRQRQKQTEAETGVDTSIQRPTPAAAPATALDRTDAAVEGLAHALARSHDDIERSEEAVARLRAKLKRTAATLRQMAEELESFEPGQ